MVAAVAKHVVHAAYAQTLLDPDVTEYIDWVVCKMNECDVSQSCITVTTGNMQIVSLVNAVQQRKVACLLCCLLRNKVISEAKIDLISAGTSQSLHLPEDNHLKMITTTELSTATDMDSFSHVLYVYEGSENIAIDTGAVLYAHVDTFIDDKGAFKHEDKISQFLKDKSLKLTHKILVISSDALLSATGAVALLSAGCKDIIFCYDAVDAEDIARQIISLREAVYCSDDGSFDVASQSSPYKFTSSEKENKKQIMRSYDSVDQYLKDVAAMRSNGDDVVHAVATCWRDTSGFEYFSLPGALSRDAFLEISRTIYCYASFVLAPLGFPEFISERHTLEEFRVSTQTLVQDIIEVCSEITYRSYDVDEASMALGVHKWTEEEKDKECIDRVQAIGLLADKLFAPPRIVEVPVFLNVDTAEEIINLIFDSLQRKLQNTCPWACDLDLKVDGLDSGSIDLCPDRGLHDLQWSCMYPNVTYSLLFLPAKQLPNRKKVSNLQLRTFIQSVAEAIQDVTQSMEAFSMIQMQAIVDSLRTVSRLPDKWNDRSKYAYYIMMHTLASMYEQKNVDQDQLQNIRERLHAADMQWRLGNHDSALQSYTELLSHLPTYHPKVCHPLIGSARCLKELGFVAEAVELNRIVQRIDPFYDEAYEFLGSIKEELNEPEDAMQNYVTAFILRGSRSIELADSVDRVSKVIGRAAARPIFAEMLKNHRLPSEWLVQSYFEGFAYDADYVIALPQNIEKHFDVSFNQLDAETLVHRAIHRKRCKDYTQAKEDIEAVIKMQLPDNLMAIAFNLHASFLYIAGDVDAALDAIDQSLSFDPNLTNSLIKKAGFLVELSDFAPASELYDKALELDPTNSDIYLHRGQSAVLQDDFAKAVEWLRRAMARCTSIPITHVIYGIALYRHGSICQANDVFAEANAMFDKSAEIHLFYGEILSDQGNYSSAMHHFLKAFELSPRCPLPFLNAGRVYVATNDPRRSIAHFREALKIDPRCSSAHLDIAQVLFAQGRTIEAFEHYTLAIRSCRYLPEIEEACSSKAMADMQLKVTETLGVDLRQIMRQK